MSPDSSSPSPSRRTRRGGLGRGLESLIPTSPGPPDAPSSRPDAAAGTPLEVPIDAISPNPWQPRSSMDDEKLQELATSIRTHGIMQPLIVIRGEADGAYTLIAGERRWRAARLAGLATAPVIIKDATPQAMLELAIIENVVRADLSALEEALAYRQLIEDFGLTQAQVAERVGKSRVAITNTLRLLNAPPRMQEALAAGSVSEGHVRAVLGLPSVVDQLALLDRVLEKGLSVRQTEEQVRSWLGGGEPTRPSSPGAADIEASRLEQRLREALGTRVTVRRGKDQTGSITIQFYSDEHLQGVLGKLIDEDHW